MSQLSTFFPTVTATSLGLGNSSNVTFGSVTTGAVTASGTLSGAGFTNRFASPGPIGSTMPSTGAFTTLSANNGTITASAPVLDLSQTWNNAAVTFTGLRFNVTNTASASQSALLDLQVGGSSQFAIWRNNQTRFFGAHLTWFTTVGFETSAAVNGAAPVRFCAQSTSGEAGIRASGNIVEVMGATATNPQVFRIYNTYTDASNHERGFMRWSSNVLQIGTEAGGTGSIRQIQFPLGTVTASTPMEITQTWNNSAIPFTAFRINVTNTASQFSGATSFLQEWQLGGVIVASVQPSGLISCRGLGTASGGTVTINGCYTIAGPAGGVMEVRQGTTPMDVRFFNTVSGTNNVNFERANLRWASNEFIIDTASGGNGTLRGIKIGSATSSLLGFYGATPVDRPATVADPTGGGTVDAEARTAINDIIDRLQELGLIA